jgi:hypothetical protein
LYTVAEVQVGFGSLVIMTTLNTKFYNTPHIAYTNAGDSTKFGGRKPLSRLLDRIPVLNPEQYGYCPQCEQKSSKLEVLA